MQVIGSQLRQRPVMQLRLSGDHCCSLIGQFTTPSTDTGDNKMGLLQGKKSCPIVLNSLPVRPSSAAAALLLQAINKTFLSTIIKGI